MFRRSRFKHVFGKANKREFCYDNIRITTSSWDSTFCSVNPKFLAVITEAAGGGAFLVLPLEKYGRVDHDSPLVAGHKAAVLDIQWCPFNDNLIASASEDCTVKLWLIPDEGLSGENLTEPAADLVAHQRRVGLVIWHPTAEYVLLSAGADNMVFIWNVYTQEVLKEIAFNDMVLSASFNYIGSLFACTCKDKKTRIVDPRTGEIKAEAQCHEGNKPQRVVYVKGDRIVTTGFSKMSERQVAIFSEDNLEKPLELIELDTSNGVMFPFYDFDTSLLYLCGKGDSQIRYFEVFDGMPHFLFLSVFQSSEPQRGIGFMPKRGLDVNSNEIARIYKLHTKNLIEIIPFTVPRKSELFQDDLYPDTVGDMPSLTAEDWFSGKDAEPILTSLKDGFVSKHVQKPVMSNKNLTHKTTNAAPTDNAHTKSSGSALASARRTSLNVTAVSTAVSATHATHTTNSASLSAPRSISTVGASASLSPSSVAAQEHSQLSAQSAAAHRSGDHSPAPASANTSAPLRPSAMDTQCTATCAAAEPSPAAVVQQTSTPGGAASVAESNAAVVSSAELQHLLDDMRKLKIIIKGHEKRIKMMETKFLQQQ